MTKTHHVRVAANGRMVLPRAVRAALDLHGAATVAIAVVGGEARLVSASHSARRAQALYRRHATARSTVDAFLAERPREADV